MLLEALAITPAAHLYVIPHALYKLHGRFDEVLSRILLQDKLGTVRTLFAGRPDARQETLAIKIGITLHV